MADDYDYDVDDDYMGFDDDWLYVEDEFLLADELAETQVPDPGYAGTNYDIAYDSMDFDLFMFWDDLEYGYDEYWDYGGVGRSTDTEKLGHKRKLLLAHTPLAPKRRKISSTGKNVQGTVTSSYENVVLMSQEERNFRNRRSYVPLFKAEQKKFALLPDWKSRFSNGHITTATIMPLEMRRAAEALDVDEVQEKMENDGKVSNEDESDKEAGDSAEPPGLTPELLKTILQQRLGEAGLGGMEEQAMETITKMMSGDAGADEAMAELAGSLLESANNQEGEGVTNWLSSQGVSLENPGDDDASSVATADLPDPPPPTLRKQESAKRKTPLSDSNISASPKRNRRVKFDVPSSNENSQRDISAQAAPESSETMEEGQDDGGAPEDTIEVNGTTNHTNHKASGPMDQDDDDEDDMEEVIEVKARVSPKPKKGRASKANTQNDAPKQGQASANVRSGADRPSRKRKAAVEAVEVEDEIVVEPPAAKRTRAAPRASRKKSGA